MCCCRYDGDDTALHTGYYCQYRGCGGDRSLDRSDGYCRGREYDVWCGEGNEYGQVQGLPARFVSDKELCKLALSVAHDGNVYGGLICSGDKFITDKEELTEIKKRFPEGMAVDMESCAIAQVCYMCGVPFLSYRIISDTPGVKDHYKQYLNFWEEAPKRSFEMIKVLIKALSEE